MKKLFFGFTLIFFQTLSAMHVEEYIDFADQTYLNDNITTECALDSSMQALIVFLNGYKIGADSICKITFVINRLDAKTTNIAREVLASYIQDNKTPVDFALNIQANKKPYVSIVVTVKKNSDTMPYESERVQCF